MCFLGEAYFAPVRWDMPSAWAIWFKRCPRGPTVLES
jgi:hypothetical protein